MEAPAGKFEGTWKVTRGTNVGELFTIEKFGDGYRIKKTSTLLTHDPTAFTLKNDRACLSLFQGSEQLFGVEEIANGYTVWSAGRIGQGTPDRKVLDPEVPDWRPGEDWVVRARTGGVPVILGGKLKIQESNGGLSTYLLQHNGITIDQLALSQDNRTLDSNLRRSIACWNREGGPNLIFGMVTTPDIRLDQDQIFDIEAIRTALRKVGRYLPLEIEMLAWDLAMQHGSNGTSIGVWGAEEG